MYIYFRTWGYVPLSVHILSHTRVCTFICTYTFAHKGMYLYMYIYFRTQGYVPLCTYTFASKKFRGLYNVSQFEETCIKTKKIVWRREWDAKVYSGKILNFLIGKCLWPRRFLTTKRLYPEGINNSGLYRQSSINKNIFITSKCLYHSLHEDSYILETNVSCFYLLQPSPFLTSTPLVLLHCILSIGTPSSMFLLTSSHSCYICSIKY